MHHQKIKSSVDSTYVASSHVQAQSSEPQWNAKGYGDRDKQTWRTSMQFILVTMSAVISINIFDRDLTSIDNVEYPTILQVSLSLLLVGMPIMYAEIFLGQYTRLGPTQLKYLNAVAHGLGYSLVITCILRSIKIGIDMSDMMIYFCVTLYSEWLDCPKWAEGHCLGVNQVGICKNDYCRQNEVNFSSQIYWETVYMQHISFDPHKIYWDLTNSNKAFSLIISWLIIVLIIWIVPHFHKMSSISAIITECLLVILLCVLIMVDGAINGIRTNLQRGLTSAFSWRCWLRSIGEVAEKFGIGRAIPMMHGSYLQPNKSIGLLTIGCFVVMLFTHILCTFMIYASIGIIQHKSGFEGDDMLKVLLKHDQAPALYTLLPQAIGYVNARTIWMLFYFGSCFTILLVNQLTHIFIIERALLDSFPALIYYEKYTMGIMFIAFTLCGLLICGKSIYMILRHLFGESLPLLEILNATLITVVVFMIYRVQRIVDDIQFNTGARPSFFWIICWYFCPVFTICTFGYEMIVVALPTHAELNVHHYIIIMILVMPIPLLLIYEIFIHLKKHNLSGILLPAERWGPADPEERFLRQLFHPRLEIRCRRRKEVCKHHCLQNSINLESYASEESKMRIEMRDLMEDYYAKFSSNDSIDTDGSLYTEKSSFSVSEMNLAFFD